MSNQLPGLDRPSKKPLLLPLDERPARVPEELKSRMSRDALDYLGLPEEYITYHLDLATAELERLQKLYDFRIIEGKMEPELWGDSMKLYTVIIVTKWGMPVALRWNDTNRGFMKKTPSGAWTLAYEEDVI